MIPLYNFVSLDLTTDCSTKLANRNTTSMFYRITDGSDYGVNWDSSIPEPVFLATANCLSEEITIPYFNFNMKKESFGVFVVIIDLVVIFSFMIFVYILDERQKEYI